MIPSHCILSVSMIVKNEAEHLPDCLASIRGVADEIVIVDTGSTDDSVRIAEAFGANVFHKAWTDDFAEARNESLRHCSGAWVLYLDADERLSPGQEDLTRSLVASTANAGYNVRVRNIVACDGKKTLNVMPYPRLFQRLPGVSFEGRVHEQIAPSILRTGGRITNCGLVIEHLGYGESEEKHREKAKRNIQLLSRQLESDPKDAYTHFQLGNSFLLIQEREKAKEHLGVALASPALARSLKALIRNMLAQTAIDEGDYSGATDFAQRSLEDARHQVTARWLLAGAHIKREKYRDAVPVLQEIVDNLDGTRAGRVDIAVDMELDEAQLFRVLGQCLARTGAFAEAFSALHRGVALAPVTEDFLRDVADVAQQAAGALKSAGRVKEAEEILDAARATGVRSLALENTALEIALQLSDAGHACAIVKRMIGLAPKENGVLVEKLRHLERRLSTQAEG